MRHPIRIPGVEETVGHFELDSLLGCAAIGISHALVINAKHRGKGYATIGMMQRINLCQDLGYKVLICTVVVGNERQEAVLKKFKFRPITEFDNPATGNKVGLWYKNLQDPYEAADFYEHGGCR